MVRRPAFRRRARASSRMARISFTPDATAEADTKRDRVREAMSLATVVLPTPGGPQKIIEGGRSCSIARRRKLSDPTRAGAPSSSSRARGRIRSASGASAAGRSGSDSPRSGKRESVTERALRLRGAESGDPELQIFEPRDLGMSLLEVVQGLLRRSGLLQVERVDESEIQQRLRMAGRRRLRLLVELNGLGELRQVPVAGSEIGQEVGVGGFLADDFLVPFRGIGPI